MCYTSVLTWCVFFRVTIAVTLWQVVVLVYPWLGVFTAEFVVSMYLSVVAVCYPKDRRNYEEYVARTCFPHFKGACR